ncbi:26856_t:CDS:2 [Gigaspora margarita]|uniref:26856_t:CDS:1 n=1 Tax=Gigaspora margarita TaxID=4874 RepID=A0ABM8W1E3_GIGMA|nr:26856_t:CDS:2 [Gigaspora margarita]
MNIEQIDKLPKFKIILEENMNDFEIDIKETVQTEKCEIISAILIGIVSTFDKHDKIKMHKEYSLFGVNNKG